MNPKFSCAAKIENPRRCCRRVQEGGAKGLGCRGARDGQGLKPYLLTRSYLRQSKKSTHKMHNAVIQSHTIRCTCFPHISSDTHTQHSTAVPIPQLLRVTARNLRAPRAHRNWAFSRLLWLPKTTSPKSSIGSAVMGLGHKKKLNNSQGSGGCVGGFCLTANIWKHFGHTVTTLIILTTI